MLILIFVGEDLYKFRVHNWLPYCGF